MACTPPTTRSPGKLYLKYTHFGTWTHTMGFRFINGVDIADTVNLRIEANRLAAAISNMMPSTFVITDWGIRRADGTVFYEEPFVASYIGTHGNQPGMVDFVSHTFTFTGHGTPGNPLLCAGKSRTVVYVGNGYALVRGRKRYDSNDDAAVRAALLAINASTYVPADYYGQQISYGATLPEQFNAYTQRKDGT